jgi:hypothetical protein
MSRIESASRAHIELLKENAGLSRQNATLRDQPNIARELMERYVAPDMYEQADRWLKSKTL